MKIEKIKIHDSLYLIAVTDKKGNVIAAGAFEYQEEAETAANIIHTMLVKKNEPKKGPSLKIDDIVRMLEAGGVK